MTGWLGNDFPRRKSRRGRLNRIQTSAAHFAYWITRVSRSLADIPQLQHPAARKWSHRPGISLSSEPRPPPWPPRRRGRGGEWELKNSANATILSFSCPRDLVSSPLWPSDRRNRRILRFIAVTARGAVRVERFDRERRYRRMNH